MANQFSDNFNVASDNANLFVPGLVDASKSHARVRKKRMYHASGAVLPAADTIVMGSFKSSDRLYGLEGSVSLDSGTTGLIDLGLCKSGLDHDASVILLGPDADVTTHDCFCDGEEIDLGVLARVDWFTQATDFLDYERGLRLWELVNVLATAQAATLYTEDPMEDWDLYITVTEVTTIAVEIMIEAEFVSFG